MKKTLVAATLVMALALGMGQVFAQQQSPAPTQDSQPYMMCPMMQQMGGQHMMGHGQMRQGMHGQMHRCCMMMQTPQTTTPSPQGNAAPVPAGN